MASADQLRELLAPTAATGERIRGLLATGLRVSDVSAVAGVSPSTVRNWVSGQSEPRSEAAEAIDDLRAALRILVDGGLDNAQAGRWMLSRSSGGARPIDLIPAQPLELLAAAQTQTNEIAADLEQHPLASGVSR